MEAGVTVFERDIQYGFQSCFGRIGDVVRDALFLRRRMERESRDALFRAKQILEKSKNHVAD